MRKSGTEPLVRIMAEGDDEALVRSTVADVKMRIWNHDGGEVESCGNASRCVVALTGAATIEELGAMVTFLCSPLSGYTTGTIITVDGGASSRRA